MNWTSFWDMGGYALYVWSAYGIALAVLLVCFLLPMRRHRALRRRLTKSIRESTR